MPRYSRKNRTNRKYNTDDYKYEKYKDEKTHYKKGGQTPYMRGGKKRRVKRTMRMW